jgi:uncharacterized protein with PIN domain
MFIDASALTAILGGEADAPQLAGRMQRGRPLMTSPIAVWETAAAIARALGLPVASATQVVFDYLREAEIELAAYLRKRPLSRLTPSTATARGGTLRNSTWAIASPMPAPAILGNR